MIFFFSSRRRHTRYIGDWSSDVCSSDLLSLSAHEKVRVARKLDELGIHLIEAGFPASNPKEQELFELLASERFETAEIAAFGMTRRRDVAAADDPALGVLASCFAPVCTLVGKT